jgi:hypothetical protein
LRVQGESSDARRYEASGAGNKSADRALGLPLLKRYCVHLASISITKIIQAYTTEIEMLCHANVQTRGRYHVHLSKYIHHQYNSKLGQKCTILQPNGILHMASFFSLAQARPDPVTNGPGLARLGGAGRAWALPRHMGRHGTTRSSAVGPVAARPASLPAT